MSTEIPRPVPVSTRLSVSAVRPFMQMLSWSNKWSVRGISVTFSNSVWVPPVTRPLASSTSPPWGSGANETQHIVLCAVRGIEGANKTGVVAK